VTEEKPAAVTLVAVDDTVLAELVRVATAEAAADEVTPRGPAGGPDWTPERVAWLRRFHTERRTGLDGPAGEATWAVLVDGRVAGSVRLQRTVDPAVLETGAWLARAQRGRGVGRAALTAVLQQAALAGATAVRADTTAGNAAALALLDRAGFVLADADAEQGVHARLPLGPSRG